MRRLIRRILPYGIRKVIRSLLRQLADFAWGRSRKFARRGGSQDNQFRPVFRLEQRIMPSASYEQKLDNLKLAESRLAEITIFPGEIFSFWKLMGEPTGRRGFRMSRTIREGQIDASEGGGLCQVAGLFYEAALRAGFKIAERYNHSVDIYAESERFTALGLDAAVVYAFKDLRFVNTSATAVAMPLRVMPGSIALELLAKDPKSIIERRLVISRSDNNHRVRTAIVAMTDPTTGVETRIQNHYLVWKRKET